MNCKACGNEIKIAIFKGGDWCCDDCRKILKKREEETNENVPIATQSGQNGRS